MAGFAHRQSAAARQAGPIRVPAGGARRAPAQRAHSGSAGEYAALHDFSRMPSREGPAGKETPPEVGRVLSSHGRPLDGNVRRFFEAKLGSDFSDVRIHDDRAAAEASRSIHARAYTAGRNIVFGAGEYAPETPAGRRVLAHELTHVVQQGGSRSPSMVQRVPMGAEESADADAVAEREYGGSGAPKATTCGAPSWFPAGFCSPYRSQKLAEYYRAKNGGLLMAGISVAVDSRVVPLWREYLNGGSSPKNLTGDFGADFTGSPTTKKATDRLYKDLKSSLSGKVPALAPGGKASIDIKTLIPGPIADLDDPASPNQMNFNAPRDIPGNLAGGIGKDQLACKSGAQPSPFNDERHASGVVNLERKGSGDITATPAITYLVKDTIDLCPGDCGTALEQVATVPLSQFEATGISGDVPFTVEFPAPAMATFTLPAPAASTPPAAPPAHTKPAAKPPATKKGA